MRATIDKQTKKSAALEFNQRLARRSCAPKSSLPQSACGNANGASLRFDLRGVREWVQRDHQGYCDRCLRRINVDPYWDIVAAAGILRNYFQISGNDEQARSSAFTEDHGCSKNACQVDQSTPAKTSPLVSCSHRSRQEEMLRRCGRHSDLHATQWLQLLSSSLNSP